MADPSFSGVPAGFRVATAAEIDPEILGAFLERCYGPVKAGFLRRHGAWFHRGDVHRLAVVAPAGEIAAYCAVLPARCALGRETLSARWWIDLVVAPEFRGRGLQTLLDRRVREAGGLLLGFPNRLAARIHRKHGWGVVEDYRVLIQAFDPTALRRVATASGLAGLALRFAARALRPLTAWNRVRRAAYLPRTARRLHQPGAEDLAGIFERHRPAGTLTTLRDAPYLTWRYLEAPYRSQLGFYAAGSARSPSLAAVTRTVASSGRLAVRLLDLFGDLADREAVSDLLRLVARDAAAARAFQLTALVSDPRLRPAFRSAGLWPAAPGRFCWLSGDSELMRRIERCSHHWCLADSDSDAPA